MQKGSSRNIYTWNPNVPYLIGKDLLLEAKQRTNGFQVDIENRTPRVETVGKVISDIISDIIQIIIHPGRLTWNTPMEGWKRSVFFLNESFVGSMLIFQGVQSSNFYPFLHPKSYQISTSRRSDIYT